MADLVKVVTTTLNGEGSFRGDNSSNSSLRNAHTDPGKETTRQINPVLTLTKESTPGKATSVTSEVSPDRITRQLQQPVTNRKIQEASVTSQTQEAQRTERQGVEDEGFAVTFKMRISDFLGGEVA